MLILLLKDKNSNLKEYSFHNKDSISLGRNQANTIVVNDPTVSSYHFKIIRENLEYYIEDLNSTNGTYLNGKEIKKEKLKNNDTITFSFYTINVKIIEINMPAAEIDVIENPVDERNKFIINKTLTFIGSQRRADIPAKPFNSLYPLSDFSTAILLKNEKYILIPINEDLTKLNSKKHTQPVELKPDDIIEVGITKFLFKILNISNN